MIKKFTLKKLSLLVLVPILLVYLPTLGAFFQQDEWIAFGNAYASSSSLKDLLFFAFAPNVGHYVPFHYLVFDLIFKLFGASFAPWMLFSIFWHLLTTYLVGLLLFRLLKNKYYAFLGMLFFGLSAATSQATTWAVADINTHGATFFGLLSLLYFDKFLEKNTKTKSTIYLSLLFCLTSLMFKEVTIAFFVTVPLLTFVRSNNFSLKKLILLSRSWLFLGAGYIAFRVLSLLLPRADQALLATVTQSKQLIIYNVLTSPGKVFWQSLFPTNFWYILGQKLGYLPARLFSYSPNSFEYEHFVQGKFLEVIFIILFILTVSFVLYQLLKSSHKYYVRLMTFSLVFVAINSLIYALSPGRSGLITLIDGRNLYFCLFGVILFAFSSYELFKDRLIIRRIFYVLFSLLLMVNIIWLIQDVNNLNRIGFLRKSVLAHVSNYMPTLKDKSIIYVQSDKSYYGLPPEVKIPPFQSGFGQTLLVWYSRGETLPKEFYSNYFLWPIDSQGYLESEGRGFGYYREYSDLIAFMKKNQFPIDHVVSFRWESAPEALTNITTEIQLKLKDDIKKDN